MKSIVRLHIAFVKELKKLEGVIACFVGWELDVNTFSHVSETVLILFSEDFQLDGYWLFTPKRRDNSCKT